MPARCVRFLRVSELMCINRLPEEGHGPSTGGPLAGAAPGKNGYEAHVLRAAP
ncbi:predicted protein [Streptomyces viridosporus ATCC 14672]|uniref:Predicted protein n=1 Tax=Streptomyces viridosporus (strain ATCC 14672 / DSM 40746 / JCM 4963 / KCTC 9882 / NRRL B-12104 / FH 1290) TaxID=566461 RepID=D5ZT64_STRV1|nr:predicted protein [Streptomyces viridosporus ATCC 14672]